MVLTIKNIHGKLMCIESDQQIYVNSDKAGRREGITIGDVDVGNGKCAMKSAHEMFVSSRRDGMKNVEREEVLTYGTSVEWSRTSQLPLFGPPKNDSQSLFRPPQKISREPAWGVETCGSILYYLRHIRLRLNAYQFPIHFAQWIPAE
jgi:hypothetical protein